MAPVALCGIGCRFQSACGRGGGCDGSAKTLPRFVQRLSVARRHGEAQARRGTEGGAARRAAVLELPTCSSVGLGTRKFKGRVGQRRASRAGVARRTPSPCGPLLVTQPDVNVLALRGYLGWARPWRGGVWSVVSVKQLGALNIRLPKQ